MECLFQNTFSTKPEEWTYGVKQNLLCHEWVKTGGCTREDGLLPTPTPKENIGSVASCIAELHIQAAVYDKFALGACRRLNTDYGLILQPCQRSVKMVLKSRLQKQSWSMKNSAQ